MPPLPCVKQKRMRFPARRRTEAKAKVYLGKGRFQKKVPIVIV